MTRKEANDFCNLFDDITFVYTESDSCFAMVYKNINICDINSSNTFDWVKYNMTNEEEDIMKKISRALYDWNDNKKAESKNRLEYNPQKGWQFE